MLLWAGFWRSCNTVADGISAAIIASAASFPLRGIGWAGQNWQCIQIRYADSAGDTKGGSKWCDVTRTGSKGHRCKHCKVTAVGCSAQRKGRRWKEGRMGYKKRLGGREEVRRNWV